MSSMARIIGIENTLKSRFSELVRREYPTIKNNHSTKIHLGMAMKELGYDGKTHGGQTYYRVIPLKAA